MPRTAPLQLRSALHSLLAKAQLANFIKGYQPGDGCPNCGSHGWHVGRLSAECMGCGLPQPLPNPGTRGAGVYYQAGSTTAEKPREAFCSPVIVHGDDPWQQRD